MFLSPSSRRRSISPHNVSKSLIPSSFLQADLVGGTYARSTKQPVALMGFDCQATPVELEVESLMAMIKEQTPDWKTLSDITILDALSFTDLTGSSDSFEVKNVNGIPIIFAKAYLNSPEKDPASLTLAF